MKPFELFTQLYIEGKTVTLSPLSAKQATALRQAVYRQRSAALASGLLSQSLPLLMRQSDTDPTAYRFYVASPPKLQFTLC